MAAGQLAWGRFVGRERELQRLKDAADAAFEGESITVFIGGEPGIGKTRLAREVGLYASDHSAVVLSGRCYDEEAFPAYTPFVEALQQYVSACPSEELAQHLADTASNIARLVPQIRELFPNLATLGPADPEQERFNIHDAVALFLARIAAAVPLVLILDDFHWADRASLQLLRYLVRKLRTERVLFVATYRDTDMSNQLDELLSQLKRESHFEHVQLKGFSAEEAVSFMAAVTDPDLDRHTHELARAIQLETEGNPFFIEATIGYLVESQSIYFKDGRWTTDAASLEGLGIPEGVRNLIRLRLAKLSEQCRQLLVHAAVLGREFEFDLLSGITGQTDDVLFSAIDEALTARLLTETPGRGGPIYAFFHALVRHTIYDGLNLARRQRLHARAAEGIERIHANNPGPYLGMLADHYRIAGRSGDPQKAIDYLIRAGEAALRLGVIEEAIRHWQTALGLVEEFGCATITRGRLLERLGGAMLRNRDIQGVELSEQALAIYESSGIPADAARVHSALGFFYSVELYSSARNIPRALEHFRKAVAQISSQPPREATILLYMGLSVAASRGMRRSEALDASQQAIDLADSLGSESVWPLIAAQRAQQLFYAGSLSRALELVEQAWNRASQMSEQSGWQMLRAVSTSAWVGGTYFGSLGDLREARRWYYRGLQRTPLSRAPAQHRMLASLLATTMCQAGDVSEALRLQNEASLPAVDAVVAFYTGHWAEAAQKAAGDAAEARKTGSLEELCLRLAFLAGIQRRAGSYAESEASLREIVSIVSRSVDLANEMMRFPPLALVYALMGRSQDALPYLERCREISAAGEHWRALTGSLARSEGAVKAAQGRFSEAEEFFAQSVNTFRHYGLPWEEAETFEIWGQSLYRSDKRIQGSEKFDRALEIYRQLGVGRPWVDQILRHQSDSTGVTVGPADDLWRVEDNDGAREQSTRETSARSSESQMQRGLESTPSSANQRGVREAVFVRQGEYWELCFSESLFRLRDIKGLGYIRHLIREPGQRFHALDLVQGAGQLSISEMQVSGAETGSAVLDKLGMHRDGLSDAGEMLDEAAKAAYRRRLQELNEELEEARQLDHLERVSKAEDELDALKRELARAVGLRGRNRRAASAVERARVSVTRAIKDALIKIARHDAEFGEFLSAAIHTGNYCFYDPEQSVRLYWRL